MLLTKRDAEALLEAIDDHDALRAAILRCLRVVLREHHDTADVDPLPTLLAIAAARAGWPADRAAAMTAPGEHGLCALQELATELAERRSL